MVKWDIYWKDYLPSKAEKYLILERDKVIKSLLLGRAVEGTRILEVGSGFASNSRMLKESGYFSCCLDLSGVALKRIDNSVSCRIKANAAILPFEDNSFDLVFSAGLIEHYRNPDGIISEMFRVAKKGGIVLNFVPAAFSLWQAYIFFKKITGGWMHGYEESYTSNKLKHLYPEESEAAASGGIDFLSIKGLLLKLFGTGLIPDIHIGKNTYTEIYYAARK